MSFTWQSLVLLLSFHICQGLCASASTWQACASLYAALPGQISFSGSDAYEKSISSYTYIGTRLRPTCLASPKSTKNVATIVKTLARFPSVGFAIRGGGHNTNRGFADIEDGVTVDLSGMNTVQFRGSASVVSVGPGARWQKVYDTIDPYGVSIQGGRNGDVGVGGFLTGGGIGFFSPQKGWACDYVDNFEVVLSNGTVVNANAHSNSDLFSALKGGLNNFGIVTRFDLKTLVQGPMWGGVILYANTTDQQLIDTLLDVKDPKKFDPYAMFTFGFVYDAAQRTFGADIAMYHSRPDRVTTNTLQSFTKIQPQIFNSIRTGSVASFAGEKLAPVVKSSYMHWSTTTITISPTALSRIQAYFRQTSTALTDTYGPANLTIAVSIQSVPPAASASLPNSLGFDPSSHPELNLLNIGLAFQYDGDSATEDLDLAIKQFTQGIDQIAEEEGARDEHLYLNYAGSWQDVFAGYGNESLARMRAVAKKYDATGMFQKQVRGGYKLDG